MRIPKSRPKALLAASTIALGLFAAIALLGVGEIIVRVLKPASLRTNYHVKLAPRLAEDPALAASLSVATRLPAPLPAERWVPWVPSLHSLHYSYDSGYFARHPEIGQWAVANGAKHARQTAADGSLVYEVTYHTDSAHRRITPGQTGRRDRALLFMGCSFTYGEGLRDEESLPAQAARLQSTYRVYNYSFHGWGPGNLLRWASQPDFAADVPRGPGGKAVYLFIDSHLDRMVGTLPLYRALRHWGDNLPYYYLDGQSALRSEGMIGQRWPRDPIFGWLAGSSLLTYLGINLPLSLGEGDFELFSRIAAEIQAQLRQKLGQMDLYVAFYPGSLTSGALVPHLHRQGVHTIDYSAVDLTRYLGVPMTLPDGHPSAATDRFLAHQILTDLGVEISKHSD
jgi:hypothetical protein